MLAADVRFEGFTQSDWSRVLSLFRPRAAGGKERDPDRPRGGVIAVHSEGRLRKLLHTQAGRLRLDDVSPVWPISPQELARRHHASWAISMEAGSLENVMERFGARVNRRDDFTAQSLLFISLVREEMLAQRIHLYPARLSGIPVPSKGVVAGTLDAVCPRGESMLIGLFDAGELWTCVALRRGASGGFDWIVGPDEIRRDMGLLAGDWRRDYRHLTRAIEHKVGKLSLGVFAEMATVRALEVDPSPNLSALKAAVVECGPTDRVLRNGFDEPFDLVVLDPPREGAKRAVVEQVVDRRPRGGVRRLRPGRARAATWRSSPSTATRSPRSGPSTSSR